MSFGKGWGSIENDVRDLADQRAKAMATRFYVKDGASRNVIFLDEEPTVVEEYMIQQGSDWRNREFVTRPEGNDPFLKAGLKSEKMYVWSILDVTPKPAENGRPPEKQEFKKLFVCRPDIAKLLYDKSKNWNGLLHKPVKISRSGKRSPAVGSDFELILIKGAVSKVDVSRYKDAKPFDYRVILAPPSPDEAIRLLAKASMGEGDAGEAVDLSGSAPHPADNQSSGAPPSGNAFDSTAPSGGIDESFSDIPF